MAMGWLKALAQRLGSSGYTPPTQSGAATLPPSATPTVRFSERLDRYRGTLTKRITFQSLLNYLEQGDDGSITYALQIFDEIERNDCRIRSLMRTRRNALINLDWQIVSAADVEQELADRELADKTAAYCREKLSRLKSFTRALKHLAGAVSRNVAAVELVWGEGSQLIDLVPVWSWRLAMKPQEGFGIRVTTDAEPIWGIPAEAPKFVVHVPESQSGSPISDSLMRCVAILWLFKKLALADWGIFCEVFGMPVRIGKYPPGASPEEKKQLFEMLEKMGANTWGAFSAGTEIELAEAVNRGTSPFEAFIALINREFGIAFTGANLTTDTTGGTGTFASANVQEGVREDLRDADIADESCMVREQMLTPMVQFAFGPAAPVPYFQRVKPEAIDRLNEANVISAAQRAGMKVGLEWAHKRLSIPKPDEDDEALRPSMDLFGAALEEGEINAETPGEEEN